MPEHDAAPGALASDQEPTRFVPFRRRDVVRMLVEEGRLDTDDQERLEPLAELLSAVFHYEFHDRLEDLKDAFAPFDRDPDTRTLQVSDEQDRAAGRQRLVDELRTLLDDANFEPVGDDELATAFEEESLLRLELDVDLDGVEHVLFFRRGETTREEELSSWWGLRTETVRFTNYEKVLVLVTFADAEPVADQAPDELPFEPGTVVLKLFQDVPRADLEMLFPNTQVRMRTIDKLLIGVPAVVSGAVILATKLLTTLGLVALLLGFWLGIRDEPVELDQAALVTLAAGLGSLFGYLTRQVTKFKSRKMEFLATLADNLYFRNLDNDVGVLHHLLDSAEEEEVKEALLGWYFLRAADRPLTHAELDGTIESWFAEAWECDLDFEVDDGVGKLVRLGLVDQDERGRLHAAPASAALARLDERWDAYFAYDRSAAPTG